MTMKEMQDKVIRRFGFEHPATIYFFGECERTQKINCLAYAYDLAMSWVEDEEEDEDF